MKRVWNDTQRLYGSAFPVLVQDRCLSARGATRVPQKDVEALVAHSFIAATPPVRPIPVFSLAPRPMAIKPEPTVEECIEVDYSGLTRKSLVELCRERGLSVRASAPKSEIIRLLGG